MARSAPRTLEVVRSQYITPHMLRITLAGSELTTFPTGQNGAYIKLIFPQEDGARPLLRTYTISDQRQDAIDVDFVIHDTDGPASSWALNAKPKDKILVGGPGPKKLINLDADWFFLVGDMTSLPSITVNLAQLPEDACGHIVIQVMDNVDIQDLKKPLKMCIRWVINNEFDTEASPLVDYVKKLPWLDGQPAVWAACEFHDMRTLRKYFKFDRSLPKSHTYISSYWKIGRTEDQHKADKQDDSKLQQQ